MRSHDRPLDVYLSLLVMALKQESPAESLPAYLLLELWGLCFSSLSGMLVTKRWWEKYRFLQQHLNDNIGNMDKVINLV